MILTNAVMMKHHHSKKGEIILLVLYELKTCKLLDLELGLELSSYLNLA